VSKSPFGAVVRQPQLSLKFHCASAI